MTCTVVVAEMEAWKRNPNKWT